MQRVSGSSTSVHMYMHKQSISRSHLLRTIPIPRHRRLTLIPSFPITYLRNPAHPSKYDTENPNIHPIRHENPCKISSCYAMLCLSRNSNPTSFYPIEGKKTKC